MFDSNVVAVFGTLAGTASTLVLQQRGARAERAENRVQELRRDQLAAVVRVVETLANHRDAMWIREDLRLDGADYMAARERSHVTRAAITAPLTTVLVLAPELAELAVEAADAVYALRGAPTRQALAGLRADAITAADRLTVAARTLV